MAKYFLLLCISFIFYSCIPERVRIRPEKRIAVSGKIVDRNASGLSGISIVSSGALGGDFSNSPYQILGIGRTTGSGDFTFISLDTYNSDFSVSINSTNGEIYNEEYATIHFVNEEDDLSTEIKLRQVELPKIVDFNFSVVNASGTAEEIRFSITYPRQELFYRIVRGNINYEAPEGYYFRNSGTQEGIHNFNREAFSRDIPTLSGSEIIFTYSIGEEGSHEITIPVTENGSYVFEY